MGGRVSLSARTAAGALGLGWLACAGPAPVVQQITYASSEGALRRVAVMPFHAAARLEQANAQSGVSAEDAAALVTRFVAEALAARGIETIPAGDVALAFDAQGLPVARRDFSSAAAIAASEFGATSVLLGEVYRYRERSGESLGASKPASVGFQVSLHDAPSGRRLWTARFDETQKALSENVFNAQRYPGGGTRWLTAAELARWGAGAAADALPAGL